MTPDTLRIPRIHPRYTSDTSLDTPLIHPGYTQAPKFDSGGGLVIFDHPVDHQDQVYLGCIWGVSGVYPGCIPMCLQDKSEVHPVYLGYILCIQALTPISYRGLVASDHPGDSSPQIHLRLHHGYTLDKPRYNHRYTYMPHRACLYGVCLNMSDLKMP